MRRIAPGSIGAVGLCLVASAALWLAACTATFDWRESRPDAGALRMLLPCRPDRQERPLVLDGATVTLAMQSCPAGGATFSLAWADVAAPDRVTPALAALRAAASGNLGARADAGRAVARAVPGATPNAGAVQLRIEGRLPDGRPVVEHVAWFASGLRVYQAAVIGERPVPDDVLETFFAGLRLASPTSR